MANGAHWFSLFKKIANKVQCTFVDTQFIGINNATWQKQTVIILGGNLVHNGIYLVFIRPITVIPSLYLSRLRSYDLDLRSEEHTSELQSRPHLVCRLLLEKKKKINKI